MPARGQAPVFQKRRSLGPWRAPPARDAQLLGRRCARPDRERGQGNATTRALHLQPQRNYSQAGPVGPAGLARLLGRAQLVQPLAQLAGEERYDLECPEVVAELAGVRRAEDDARHVRVVQAPSDGELGHVHAGLAGDG